MKRLWPLACVVGLLASTFPRSAAAQSGAPSGLLHPAADSSAELQRLRDRIGNSSVIRVKGSFGTATLRRPSLEADGLRFSSARIVGDGDSFELPRSIPLDRVTHIASVRSRYRIGAKIGMFAGAITAIVVERGDNTNTNLAFGGIDGIGALSRMLLFVAAGTAGGAILGSVVPRWEPIYASP